MFSDSRFPGDVILFCPFKHTAWIDPFPRAHNEKKGEKWAVEIRRWEEGRGGGPRLVLVLLVCN